MSRARGGRATGLAARTVDAVPDVVLAWLYVRAATAGADGLPAALPDHLYRAAVIEFFAVHASGFLLIVYAFDWPLRRRLQLLAAIAGGYSVVTGAISLGVGSVWPLAIFWALIGNRLLGALGSAIGGRRAPEETDFNAAIGYPWAGGVVLFAVCAIGAGMLGHLERGAVLWAAAWYFALTAASVLTDWRWVAAWMARARAQSR